MVGADVTSHRRRGRPLFAGRHVTVDEPLGALEEIVVGIEGSFEHLAGDVFRNVAGPAFRSVEGDHPERVRILPAEKIADDGLAIGLGGSRLSGTLTK
jgi:hypothetical protein